MKVRIVNQPSGLINGKVWPEAGETIDLPDDVAKSMIEAGAVEKPEAKQSASKAEKRPASTKGVEKR